MKIRSFFVIFVIFFSLFSCKNTSSPPPNNILEKETVENILVEICLIDSEMKVLIFNHPLEDLNIWMNTKMEQLFIQYNTDYSQFTKSFTYYMMDTKASKKIAEDIINRLIKLQAEQSESPEEKEIKKDKEDNNNF